jgi:hypothetical protein
VSCVDVIVQATKADVQRVCAEHLPDATIVGGEQLQVIRSPSLDALSDAELWTIAKLHDLPVVKIRRRQPCPCR